MTRSGALRVGRAAAVALLASLAGAGACLALLLAGTASPPRARQPARVTPSAPTPQVEGTCSLSQPRPGAIGVLSVPSLSLAAWVWEGNSDEVLEQGVGHNPATAWPGSSGTAELSAHDVSQFSELWRLSAGDSVYFYPGCGARALYRVVKVEVVRAGEPVYTWPRPALLLETCWPPYTLSATPQRLLVYAELVRYENAGQTPVPYEPQLPSPSFPIGVDPAAYSLGRNYAPMGSMRVSGDPTPRVLQSSLPLKAEEDALQLYFALVKAEREGDRALLSSVAPNVDPSSPPASYLAGPFEYTEPVDVLENFSGDSLTQVELVIGLRSASGEHRMAVVAGAHGSTLWIDRVEER